MKQANLFLCAPKSISKSCKHMSQVKSNQGNSNDIFSIKSFNESRTLKCGSLLANNDYNQLPVNKFYRFNSVMLQQYRKILSTYKIQNREFNKEMNDEAMKSVSEETVYEPHREDLKDRFVFTIDPPDAKDLDDALHIKSNPDGSFEIGVHIADITKYIKYGSCLQKEADNRSSTVYLMNKTIPLYPNIITSIACSLNTNAPKNTLSVIYTVSPEGKILNHRIIKAHIKSRYQLSYDTSDNILNQVFSGNITSENDQKALYNSMTKLYEFAKIFRKKRMESGSFILNKGNTFEAIFDKDLIKSKNEIVLPSKVKEKIVLKSHILVEEWMIQANVTIADFLYSKVENNNSDNGIARFHMPNYSKIDKLRKYLNKLGINSEDMRNLSDVEEEKVSIINFLFLLTMNRAQYTNMVSDSIKLKPISDIYFEPESSPFFHYALAKPLYTHFTSPIRRYPDTLVHFQLCSLLWPDIDTGFTNQDQKDLDKIMKRCNSIHYRNRQLQHAMQIFYFQLFLNQQSSILTDVCFLKLEGNTISCLLVKYYLIINVELNELMPDFNTIKDIKRSYNFVNIYYWDKFNHKLVEKKLNLMTFETSICLISLKDLKLDIKLIS